MEEQAHVPAAVEVPAAVTEPTAAADLETRPGVLTLKSWIGRPVRIRLTDGRLVTGTLRCLDRDRNLLLAWATARVPDAAGDVGACGPAAGVGGTHCLQR